MNGKNNFGVIVSLAIAAVAVYVSVGWNQPPTPANAATPEAPVEAPLLAETEPTTSVDISLAIDKLTAVESEQTAVLRSLAEQQIANQEAITLLVARVDAIENPPEPVEPEQPAAAEAETCQDYCKHCGQTVTWEMRDGVWFCTHGQHFNQTHRTYSTTYRTYNGPRGIFGGRWAPIRRLFGWRPFGGRFGC